jgi:hypothetical protein
LWCGENNVKHHHGVKLWARDYKQGRFPTLKTPLKIF